MFFGAIICQFTHWRWVDFPIVAHTLRMLTFIFPEVLHSLGGNAMSLRAVLPCVCAALSACVPERLAAEWKGNRG